MSNHKDYYAILGVAPNADSKEIEEAYERLAQEVQPDVDAEPTNPERMAELDEAFDVLDDPARRAEYDRGRAGLVAPAAGSEMSGSAAVAETGVPEAATPASTSKGVDGRLLAGIGMIVVGVAAVAAAIAVLALALTDDDDGSSVTELQIEETVAGTGPSPQSGQIVTIHYTGKLEDGTEFDSSEGNPPLSFIQGSGQVIPGMEQGVETMKVGGERTITIPPELAYGEQGAGNGIIPPNATISFDVRLLAVSDPAQTAPPEVSGEEQELEGGLKVIDVVVGEGDEAAGDSTVAVHYTGWLAADGKRFDSSLLEPRVFTLTIGQGQVIEGWEKGIVGMKEGGKRRLLIPAALGYGEQGSGEAIPPNSDLIFDVELIEVREETP